MSCGRDALFGDQAGGTKKANKRRLPPDESRAIMSSAPPGFDEYQGGQRPRGAISPGRMIDRRSIGRPQEGHRGRRMDVATSEGVSALSESEPDGESEGKQSSRLR